MEKLLNNRIYTPIIEDEYLLPRQGKYHARITDVETREILPLGDEIEFCVIVKFRLVDVDTYDVYDFVETFLPYNNSRTEDFLAFLNCHGYDFTSDDEIVGLKDIVEVVYTAIGGYVHPEISFRPWGLAQAAPNCTEETLTY